jgi:hypothetical protein
MTRFLRRSALSPPIVRHFEFTRFQNQLIALAYQVLIPIVSRDLGRSPLPSSRNQPTAIPNFQSKAEGA